LTRSFDQPVIYHPQVISGGQGLAPTSSVPAKGSTWPILVTVFQDGPCQTCLDVMAARCTCVTGDPIAIAERLASMAKELVMPLRRAGGALVLLGSFVEREAAEASWGTGQVAADWPEALQVVTEAALSEVPVVLLVGATAMTDGQEVAFSLSYLLDRPNTAAVVAGPCPSALHRIEARVSRPAQPAHPRIGRARGGQIEWGQNWAVPEPLERSEELGACPERKAAVDVLGPVRVVGVGGDLGHHPKLTELAVFLSLHPEGATSPVWSEALWPDRNVPRQTIANRLSELRRQLGFAADGRPRLRRDGLRHRLVDVDSDWSKFRELSHPDHEPAQWCRALELIRGRPFTGLGEAGWTRLEGYEGDIEESVVECSLRATSSSLARADPAGAVRAAEQGLKAVPWDERLHRALMRAGAAAGNLGQVEATLRHLALVLDIEGDPLPRVHPETARLYLQLSRRQAPTPR